MGLSSSLVSGGDDCSMKLWDIPTAFTTSSPDDGTGEAPTCTLEWTLHRSKNEQGVMAVKYHGGLGILGSAGADGAVRIYARHGSVTKQIEAERRNRSSRESKEPF